MLDDKFWVWETLDEALRPIVEDLNEDQVLKVSKALAANYKGSEDLWDYLIKKVHFYAATPYWEKNSNVFFDYYLNDACS